MKAWREILKAHVAGIDHIAIAVPDLDASVGFYRDLLGCEVLARRDTRGEKTSMTSAVVRLGQTTVVLVQGNEPDSQVSRFVEACGAGVQHIALAVDDLKAVAAALSESGVRFETPLIEGPHTRQIFTVRDAAIGVRIELIERRGDGFDDRSVEQLFRFMEARGAW